MKRSDLIYESGIIDHPGLSELVHSRERYGTRYTDITADERAEREFGLRQGRYITVFTESGDTVRCVTELLGEMLPPGDALVAGLGNENICSDSLGVKALRHIPATAHLSEHRDFAELGLRKVSVLEAGVTGKTGIESCTRISCIAERIGASFIVAIDSLACAEIERLCTTIQLTDTGISPGSGVGNDRQALNSETTGIPVIAVGVPTVIDLDSITGSESRTGLMVTPRTIDAAAERLADTIGRAVSNALNPTLSEEELQSLIIL